MESELTGEEDWKRFGEIVRARRRRLGITQENVAARGGPSVATLRMIENATVDQPRQGTLHSLNGALGWPDGSVQELLYAQGDTAALAKRLVNEPDEFGRPPRNLNPAVAPEPDLDVSSMSPEEARRVLTRYIARADAGRTASANPSDVETRLRELRQGLIDIQRKASSLVGTVEQVISDRTAFELDGYSHGKPESESDGD